MRRREPIPALAPLGWLYLRVAAMRNALYERGWIASQGARVPVICIGNLSAGGVGKTPAALWLARTLEGEGRRVAIVSRGYEGRRHEDPLLVSEGDTLHAPTEASGDEAQMLARSGAASLVVVSRRRVEGARLAARHGADLVLLDDGFQHRALARDLDIVLADFSDPLAGGRGLPAGLLRESPRGLGRAGLLVLTRAPEALAALDRPLLHEELPPALRAALRDLPEDARPATLASHHVPRRWRDESGRQRSLDDLEGARVLAVAGIAQPETFARTLESCGCEVLELAAFDDHHHFSDEEATRAHARAKELEADLLITTEKDAVRWPQSVAAPARLEIAFSLGAAPLLLGMVRDVLSSFGEREA